MIYEQIVITIGRSLHDKRCFAFILGPSRTLYVGEEGQVGWRSRVWRCPLSLLQAGR